MDVQKREDRLLDAISTLTKRRDATKAWLELYQEAGDVPPWVASHLWEVLTGIETELPEPAKEVVE